MIYKIIAFIILLTFYGCYFGKMLGQRKRGVRTDQMGKGKVGVVKRIEIIMKIAACLVPVAEVISILTETTLFPDWLRLTGCCVGFAGVLVFLASVIVMGDSWRAGVPETEKTDLITGGVYRISRNPAFLGFDLVYIGILLLFFNWPLLILSAFAAVMFHLQIINVEEDFLTVRFGEAYLNYKKRVYRYLGRKRS